MHCAYFQAKYYTKSTAQIIDFMCVWNFACVIVWVFSLCSPCNQVIGAFTTGWLFFMTPLIKACSLRFVIFLWLLVDLTKGHFKSTRSKRGLSYGFATRVRTFEHPTNTGFECLCLTGSVKLNVLCKKSQGITLLIICSYLTYLFMPLSTISWLLRICTDLSIQRNISTC